MKNINLRLMLIVCICLSGCSYGAPIVEWGDGIIPYYLTGSFSDGDHENLKQAMSDWENVCGVRFREVIPDSSAYEIIRGNDKSWFSTIGENNNHSYMNFGAGGEPLSHLRHELGHCLGLLHEHQRPDRDSFVIVVWNKIYPEQQFNFEIKNNPLIVEDKYGYDYNSIMSYNPKAFSIDNSYTIIRRDGVISLQDGSISQVDISKVQFIYGLPLPPED
jgi:hypothetical protein